MTTRNPPPEDADTRGEGRTPDEGDGGTGPITDYRFTLANERTFLAWLRTALGLVAGGVAIQQLVPGLASEGPRTLLAALCVGLALVIATASYPRWRAVQRAMARGGPLPRNILLATLGGGIAAITAVAFVLVVTA
ncbi:putative membrane protein [Prauserella isguenensis]|uniref:Putative membrane protein n=1 Tax=Prauserella isguenensis TaxID=1470180 RepID=A0A839S571_9PSEU|nr:putative membrane protein [Prauserella isguenensis]